MPGCNNPHQMTLLRLTSFGGLSITALHGSLAEVATRRHALAFLALMAAAGENGMSRERMMALLWPEADEAHARNNLKQLSFAIRRGLNSKLLASISPNLRLDFFVMSADVEEFERARTAGNLELAVELYAGPFLDGFHLPRLCEFDRWIDGIRARYARRYEQALETLAHRAGAVGDVRGAVKWWRRLTEHNPVNTEYAVCLIDAFADLGEPLSALKHFAGHTRVIREEFDVDPEPSVRLAAERVRRRLTFDSQISIPLESAADD
jgi:DNA-binding SARP family transcriptional activator